MSLSPPRLSFSTCKLCGDTDLPDLLLLCYHAISVQGSIYLSGRDTDLIGDSFHQSLYQFFSPPTGIKALSHLRFLSKRHPVGQIVSRMWYIGGYYGYIID